MESGMALALTLALTLAMDCSCYKALSVRWRLCQHRILVWSSCAAHSEVDLQLGQPHMSLLVKQIHTSPFLALFVALASALTLTGQVYAVLRV